MTAPAERGSKVLRNTLWLSAAPILLNVVSIFVMGTIARSLGQADFGRFNVAFGLAQLCQSFAGFGLSTATIRTLSTGHVHPPTYAGNMIGLRLVLALGAHLLLALLTLVLDYDASTRWASILAGVLLYLQAISMACQDVFAAYESTGPTARAGLLGGLLLTLCSVVVVLSGGGLYSLVLTYLVGHVLTSVLSLRAMMRFHFTPVLGISLQFARSAMRDGAVFFVSGMLVMVVMRGDILLLSHFRGEAEAGVYAAASNIFQRLYVIPVALSGAVLPALSALAGSGTRAMKDLLGRCTLIGLAVTVPLAVGGGMLAAGLIDLIFGATEYRDAAPSLALGLVTVPLLLINQVLFRALTAVSEERWGLVTQGIGTATMVALELWLAPRHGPTGAAVAVVVGHLASSVGFFVLVQRRLGSWLEAAAFGKILVAAATMAISVWVLSPRVHVIVLVVIGAAVYTTSVLVLRVVSFAEIRRVLAPSRA